MSNLTKVAAIRLVITACALSLLITGCSSDDPYRPKKVKGFYNPRMDTENSDNGNWKPGRDRESFFLPRVSPGS